MSTANPVNTEQQATSFRLAVKKRLLEEGLTVSALARKMGLARNTVSIAVNHETMFPSIKIRIKEALGL